MLKKQWPGDDPVRERGIEAQKAMQRLYDAARFFPARVDELPRYRKHPN